MLTNRWIPQAIKPTLKQAQFLLLNIFEALYGGAAGGGKSTALLMAALQYVDIPGYSAILFRRSYTDLCKPNALMHKAHEWLDETPAHWDGVNHIWTFPSSAKLAFGYLENDRDVYHHQSAEYQFLGFDELTQFTEFQYRYMLSRVRRLQTAYVPLRVRAATNPSGEGKAWVKQRFITEGERYNRVFIPANLNDNPHLDRERYREALEMLDEVSRRQLLYGDWDATAEGSLFKHHWLKFVEAKDVPCDAVAVRFWDLAATPKNPDNKPDYTAGVLLATKNGCWYVVDVKHFRGTPSEVENTIKATAEQDGLKTLVAVEQEGGSSGKIVVDHYARNVLFGYNFHAVRSTGDKVTRAQPVSAAAENGTFHIARAAWTSDYVDELTSFPYGGHDDQVDATSGAFAILAQQRRTKGLISFGTLDR